MLSALCLLDSPGSPLHARRRGKLLDRALHPLPAETGSGGRLLDACDLEADTIGVASVPSSASSAVLSDYFIFDTEPLLADWGTLPPINPGPYRSAPLAASAGQPWAAGPTTGYAGSFGLTPAITESSPFLLDGTALTSTLPPR